MQKVSIIPILSTFLLLCQSCNNIPGTHQVRVTVLDAGSWSPENRNCSVVEEALVLLFNESDRLTKNAAPISLTKRYRMKVV